ncbi:hypothetical protein GCM10010909_20810 [Acidocella aquatica]|uniref:Glycosyltransferase RgtA/B/C/D-like domain-containing protein n=2 Tax=Acidocella aquatica TaxID=1922313 RepID=A0ABQ6ABG2_9PROT|nr:hypothetical protein GCM10010909_20810 [Acidocella aquatica]
MYPLLFLLAAALNIVAGAHQWPGVLAGSLNDPDSYMRLLRLEDGIRAGHLVITVARDDSGAGVMVEWSRLLDMVLWLLAAPFAPFIGWHRALYVAGVALGPLGVGALGVVCAWVAEPFAARRFLWAAAVAAALLPGLQAFAIPGVVHYHILLLVLIVLTVGCVARAWHDNITYGLLAGVSGGFAIWLTPETMPFVLMAFAVLLLRWLYVPLGKTITACAAGFFDVLSIALMIDPPQGGWGVPEIDRLSLVYVVLGMLLLAGAGGLWLLEARWRLKHARPLGVALMVLAVAAWVAMFPKVAMGPYGIMPAADARKFFGVIAQQQPVRGLDLLVYLGPGALALAYALWRVAARPDGGIVAGRARWLWLYIAVCDAVALVLGVQFMLFVEFAPAAAAVLLPVALSEMSLRFEARPALAMVSRLGLLLAVLLVPVAAAGLNKPPAAQGAAGADYPSCNLREIAPLLVPAAGQPVLAGADAAPELLYRTQVETVGSLYHHGLQGYLRDRAAWRATPGAQVPAAVLATGARFVLFCPTAARYPLVADLPKVTLWDVLEAGNPPAWLQPLGSNAQGWRLYKITF